MQYTNQLAIQFSLSEVKLRLGQRSSLDEKPITNSLLVSIPVHVVAFSRVIPESIAGYASRFRRIPDASALDADKGER